MKLSDWASIAEVASGIAVVITLIFLIVGISENTEVTRASMYADHLSSFDQLSADIYRDPELTRIYEAWLTADFSDLDELDLQRFEQMQINMFRTYERAYLAQIAGFYGADESERMQRLTCTNYLRSVVTRTAGLLDALMTRAFSNHMSETCPETLVRQLATRYPLFIESATGEVRSEASGQVRSIQRQMHAFGIVHPEIYEIWRQQKDSFDGAFNSWFEEIEEGFGIE